MEKKMKVKKREQKSVLRERWFSMAIKTGTKADFFIFILGVEVGVWEVVLVVQAKHVSSAARAKQNK